MMTHQEHEEVKAQLRLDMTRLYPDYRLMAEQSPEFAASIEYTVNLVDVVLKAAYVDALRAHAARAAAYQDALARRFRGGPL